MLGRIFSLVALTSVGLLACGGSVRQDDPSQDNNAPLPKTTLSAPAPASVSPYGVWDLTSLDGSPGGKQSTQTFGHLFLELRPDGKAIARRCTKPYYEPGLVSVRCADSAAYDCVYGTVTWDGESYKVDLPDLRAATKEARGEIVAEDENIIVRYILPQYSAGHFVRLTDDPPTSACAGP